MSRFFAPKRPECPPKGAVLMIFGDSELFFGHARSAYGVTAADYVRRLAEDAPDDGTVTIREESFNAVGIVGAGMMGRSIAAAFLFGGLAVSLYDTFPDALNAAPERIESELAYLLAAEGASEERARLEAKKRTGALLRLCAEPVELYRCGAILETIVEKLRVKQKCYQRLEQSLTGPKLLLTNTSTIEIGDLAEGLEQTRRFSPERFCGFHFFHPVRQRPLVEVIRSDRTSDATVAAAKRLARRIGKRPILVEDGPGFLVNRLLNPYFDEAMAALLEGVPAERIEAVCRRFGMERGPFRFMDEIGLDVTLHSGWTFYKAFPSRISASTLLPTMLDDNRLGRKNGRGFLLYDSGDGVSGRFDPALEPLYERCRVNYEPLIYTDKATGTAYPLRGPEMTDETLAARIFGGVLFEAERIVRDRIVPTLADADRALLFALGFPPSKGGIAFWAESLGPERRVQLVEALAPLGGKFSRSA